MAELGPHQENPLQANPQQTEPIESQRQSNLANPGGRGNREGSVHTTQTSQSHTQIGSHVSQRRNSHQAMQREIDDLKRKLRHVQRKRSPSSLDESSNGEDASYRRRSRTPPSETFSYEREPRPVRKYESPSSKGSGNDAMNKVLDQISRSPFMYRIEGAKLPRRFNQPVFAIYNGRADPVEHVSQFNQKMAIYSQNESLMCKVFPSSLGPMAMRWFNNLKTNSIGSYKQLT